MKHNIRYFVILCLTTSLIFVQAMSIYACTLVPASTNYWYQQSFDIQNESVMPDIRVVAHASIDSYDLGYFRVVNESDRTIYIGNSSSDEIVPNSDYFYDPTEDLEALVPNPQSPGGAEPPPSPFLYEFSIIQDSQRFTIPITVTYSLNPNYDENKFVDDAPVGDYLIFSDAVVLGEVIGATDDSESLDPDGDDIFGYARVQVEEWLLGEGPEEIEVGRFSTGTLCELSIEVGERAYFLLKAPEDTDSIRYPLTTNFIGSNTVLAANDENAVVIAEALLKLAAPTALLTADEPTHSLFLPYISR